MYFREMINKKKTKFAGKCGLIFLMGALCFSALFFAGCGSSSSGSRSSGSVFTVGKENCSKEDVKVIILQYQKNYSSLYGMDFWSSGQVDRNALEEYIKNSAVSQLARVYSLDTAGEGLGISLTEEEKQLASLAASEYSDSISKEEKSYLGISESELGQLFERYLLAEKAYDQIIASVSTEVSDDEALVMDMQVICVSDADQAANLLSRIEAGDDFTALAQSYSERGDIDMALTRTTYDDSVTDRLFSLGTGEHSDVIEIGGRYYLFYCENYFDEKLTEENKAEVLERRRENAVEEACAAFADPADSVLRSSALSKIEIDTTLPLEGPSFMEVYNKYF